MENAHYRSDTRASLLLSGFTGPTDLTGLYGLLSVMSRLLGRLPSNKSAAGPNPSTTCFDDRCTPRRFTDHVGDGLTAIDRKLPILSTGLIRADSAQVEP